MTEVLKHWKAAFDGHRPDEMSGLFTADALFQGFGPAVLTGRDAVRGYYEAVPSGRRAEFEVLHTYTIGEQVAGGFADVTFGDADGWEARVHLSLVLRRDEGHWRIRQCHVSRVDSAH
ncbi:SgcJ/EcaC family oxidoreductase [Streptomyces wuyuanensis]|uniref:SgcJ/EcaC family oxidoreductase n=1 Tax=Streptomyces wuyuanensis TaxID=1196353 RepID=UPI003443020D